jgi:hypothetical protein
MERIDLTRATREVVMTLHNKDVLEGGGVKIAPSTLRDLFAGLAMQAILTQALATEVHANMISEAAYEVADEMMTVRREPKR